MWLIHFIVQQKLAQHCKEIILQFKRKEKVNPIQKKSTKNFNSYPTISNLIQIFLLILLLTLYKYLGTCVQLSQDKFCDFIHFSPSLQCSCLENPRDGGAWWAAVYGVAQSRTLLKRLSSSSMEHYMVSCRKSEALPYNTEFLLYSQYPVLYMSTW